MKRVLTCFLILLAVLFSTTALCDYALPGRLAGREERRKLFQISEALGVDVSAGVLTQFEDTHGGFHGDGLTSAVVELGGLAKKLMNASGWKVLPMSESTAQALGMIGNECMSVKDGFYYLYDRHSQSKDPYDDTELNSRASWNFAAAVYDSQRGLLYFYQFDT